MRIKPTTGMWRDQEAAPFAFPSTFRLWTESSATAKAQKRTTGLTFKLHNFSVLGLWKPFQTDFGGEGQSNPTAPQQKTDLLATGILRGEGENIVPL